MLLYAGPKICIHYIQYELRFPVQRTQAGAHSVAYLHQSSTQQPHTFAIIMRSTAHISAQSFQVRGVLKRSGNG
jgi:hypothetical protein